jgi:hypothetical protein
MPLKTLGPIGPRAVGERVKVTLVIFRLQKVKQGLIGTTCFAWHHRVMYNYH